MTQVCVWCDSGVTGCDADMMGDGGVALPTRSWGHRTSWTGGHLGILSQAVAHTVTPVHTPTN